MAEEATLARPYAKAVFEVAREAGDDGLPRWERRLALLAAALETPKVAEMVTSPATLPAQKAVMLGDLLGEDFDERSRHLLRLLADNKRLVLLPEIHAHFVELRAAWERTLKVEVVSAYELDDAAAEQLRDRLSQRFERAVTMTRRVDSTLVGGAVIHAGDTVIDGSVRGRLDHLAEQLRVRV